MDIERGGEIIGRCGTLRGVAPGLSFREHDLMTTLRIHLASLRAADYHALITTRWRHAFRLFCSSRTLR